MATLCEQRRQRRCANGDGVHSLQTATAAELRGRRRRQCSANYDGGDDGDALRAATTVALDTQRRRRRSVCSGDCGTMQTATAAMPSEQRRPRR
eukprot:1191790-Pleurochrysis_carterae.AAC.1